MWEYIICAVICAVIWIVNGRWIIQAVRERVTSEIYMHIGLGIFFTLLTLEFTLAPKVWMQFDFLWLQVIGFILYIPSAILVFGSMLELKRKGKPETADPTSTTTFVDTGVYRVVRQPMTLGMAIWSIALILVFQSIISIILGLSSAFCFWMGARKEVEYNIKKFWDEYKKYMEKVPMWNIFKELRRGKKRLYKRRKWYDFVPPDILFLGTPFFYAFVAGTFMAVAVNLLTSIYFRESSSISMGTYVSAFLFIFSAAGFAYVSQILESCRAGVKPEKLPEDLVYEIHESKLRLSLSFLLGALSFVTGVIFIWL